jgi:DNA-binding NarL/FixJ family response regulator
MLRGLSDFLTSKGYNILGSAQDGQSAYNLIVKHKPDIAILDIRMPHKSGVEVAHECKKNNLSTKIILITFDKEEEVYEAALDAGVYGYILKEFAIEEIETCIAHVVMDEPYFSEEITSYLNKSAEVSNPSILDKLTKSERKIILLIADQKDSQEIADELNISNRTVEKHRSNIVNKLGLDRRPSTLSVWANLNKKYF